MPRGEIPIGQPCLWCSDPIGPDESGFTIEAKPIPHDYFADTAWHVECHLRMLVGGANHQARLCACYGGTLPADPVDLTPREAAIVATVYFRAHPGSLASLL